MKTRSTRSLRRLLIKCTYCCTSYIEQAGQIERALARRPAKLQLDLIGTDDMPGDIALVICEILRKGSATTHLITNARSSLRGPSVLVWLMGETRLIREDAKLYFRRPAIQDEDHNFEGNESAESEVDMDEIDYLQVLQHMDHFLPVKELAGRPIDVRVLRQFGLVDNERVDHFLASAFAKASVSPEPDKLGPQTEPKKLDPKISCSNEPNRQE